MGLRELITGGDLTRLDLDAKGFTYPQQGGQSFGSSYGGTYGALMSGLLAPTSRDYARVKTELSSALAVCLNTVAGAFPEAELCVEREVEGEAERDFAHPALKLIETPNPYFSGTDVLTAVVRDLMTSASGSAYLVKRRGQYGRVVELWPVVSSMMRPVWPNSGDTFIGAYEIDIDGTRRLVPIEDVVHFRNVPDPAPPSYGRCGVPYLPPIMQDLYIDTAAADFTSAIMRNMGLPGVILSPKALVDGRAVTLPQPVRDEFAADYQSRFTGAGRGRAMITGTPIDVHQLGFDPEKMSLREIRSICEERVAAVYNIPPIVAGFGAGLEHATYANYEAALKAFWTGCIIPIQRRIAETLTRQLLPDFGRSEGLYVEFNYDHIPAMQENETEKRQRDREDYLAGGLTHHQYVERLGIEAEGDDWVLLPANVTAYPVGTMPTAPEPEPMPEQLALPPKPDDEGDDEDEKGQKAIDRGTPLDWTDEQIEAEAIVTDADIEDAADWVRENAPDLAELLDSEETRKAVGFESKAFRWNGRTRRYYDSTGRMVSKARVEAAMDAIVEVGREKMGMYADALVAGDMDLPAYQIAMKQEIKRMHLSAVATTRGGWSQMSPRERGQAAQRIQEQYKYLNRAVLELEAEKRPLDGTVRSWSKMYASSARAAYGEADYDAAKDAAEAQPDTHQERWVRHASDSCSGCVEQENRKWVDLGELPPIGSQTCKTNCKCSKVVRRRPRSTRSEPAS